MVNVENLVDVKKVAKVCKQIGEFIMIKTSEAENLLVTRHFMLNLESEQFWKVQCALEIPDHGIWYAYDKGKTEQTSHEQSPGRLTKNYHEWVCREAEKIINTNLMIQDQYRLYRCTDGYTAINVDHIEMLKNTLEFRRDGGNIIVDRLHILTPTRDSVWEENEYLVRQ